ncbi:DUF1840 domain-containing protein [Photobacterium sanguinicancri]|uniref:DUF1840 domain-containing protein n=1 Tax=Photobacterium sanguinicancri TaxID=875932 RepID=A0AAW7Y1Q2_9GAMM|nr:DUF1840 domain-containing protein [Photobacterium sanguinicancri]MDO6541995.1 DUF1840 domain-containing protein [Photobacterium sanguinicancri]
MLITFHSKISGDITMFGDVAQKLLHYMGLCENVPGVIEAKDIPTALSHLEQNIAKLKQHELQQQAIQDADDKLKYDQDDDLDQSPPISLAIRAIPLIEMLKAAQDAECHVMWDA